MYRKTLTIPYLILLYSLSLFISNITFASNLSPKDIFLESQVNNSSPLLQSQIIYTVKLYFRIPMQDAALLDPRTDNVLTYRMGNSTTYDTVHHGTPYRVLVQRYALFPQVSGAIAINSAKFVGHSLWDGSPVKIESPRITLQVQPIPNTLPSTNWLPANKIALQETWSPSPPIFQHNQPIVRTITLQATAIPDIRLPNLFADSFIVPTQGIKVYVEPPQSTMNITQNEIISKRIWKITYLPINQNSAPTPASITIPKLDILWWNNQTKHLETISLPSRTINLESAVNNDHAQPTIQTSNISSSNIIPTNTATNTSITASSNSNKLNSFQSLNDQKKITGILSLLKQFTWEIILILFITIGIIAGAFYKKGRTTTLKNRSETLNTLFITEYVPRKNKKSKRSILPDLYPDI